jgi:uncharacterized phage protein gp47/JayE
MDIPTTTKIRDSIINSWEQRLSVVQGQQIKILQSLKKSVLYILAMVIAPAIRLTYLFVLWALNQTDPQTADDENTVLFGRLQTWGRLLKIGEPKPGQAPRYEIDITGTNGAVLLAGTAYRSASDNIYLLEDDIAIVAGVATGIIKASVPEGRQNTEFSLNPAAEVNTANPFAGIDNPATVATELTAATDAEDIEAYRARVVSVLRIAPQGGARIDYQRWPLDAEGVAAAYPFTDQVDPGLIHVYIEATTDIDPDGIPTQAVLDAAEEAIKYDPDTGIERKPVTHVFDTLPIDLLLFDVGVTGLVASDPVDAQARITDALTLTLKNKKSFIDGADPVDSKNDIITRSELLAVAVAAVAPIEATLIDLTLELATVPIETYTLTNGEKSKLGSIVFS